MYPNRFGYVSECLVSIVNYGITLSTCPEHTVAPDVRPRKDFCGYPPPLRYPPFDNSEEVEKYASVCCPTRVASTNHSAALSTVIMPATFLGRNMPMRKFDPKIARSMADLTSPAGLACPIDFTRARKEPQSKQLTPEQQQRIFWTIRRHYPLKQALWGKSHQKVQPKVRQNLCHASSLGYLFCPWSILSKTTTAHDPPPKYL